LGAGFFTLGGDLDTVAPALMLNLFEKGLLKVVWARAL
jgi:hypothetical protein